MVVESNYWVWTKKQTPELKTETLPDPGPDEVLVKARYTAVSPGTEMALYMMTHVGFADPNNKYAKYPHRGGYLSVGIIEKSGEKVAAEWPTGTWVYSGASHCQYSIARPGAGGWVSCHRLPDVLKKPETAYLGLVKVGYTAPYLAPAALGETVVVLGAGLVGSFAAQLYEASGAEVLVVEKDAFRRDIAKKCGLKTVASIDEVNNALGGAPRVVIEATGVPALCVESFKLVAPGGRVVILSSPRGEASVNFYNHIHAKVITVIGGHGRAVTDGDAATVLMIRLAEKGKVALAPCVTHTASWKDAPAVWDAYAAGAKDRLGTILDWHK